MDPTPLSIDKLKRQLAQLDALIADGVLTGEAARTAREDLERQVLQAVLAGEGAAPSAPGPAAGAAASASAQAPALPRVRLPRKLAAGVAAFVIIFAGVGYAALGNHEGWNVSPGSPAAAGADGAAAEGPSHSTESAQIEAMISKLAERLKTQPDDPEGWTMLARSYTAQGRFSDALPAFKKAYELRPKDAQAMVDYADGLAVSNNRSLDGEPEKLVMAALKIDPANVKALSLAGTVAFNRADYKGAVGYWERAVKSSDPASDFTRQLQGALNEARQRAGLPPVAEPTLLAPAAGEAAAAAPAAEAGAGNAAAAVSGRVSLKAALKGQVSPEDTVFIFARAPTGSKMPLAILRKKVSDLPLDFSLDDSMSMSPAARLSTAGRVIVGARISKSGNAAPAAGDWQVLSEPVAVGATALRIEIGEPVR
jgi:cytochrome c-type biogenesis protein CcmH